jgi:type IV secretion system protein VirD4
MLSQDKMVVMDGGKCICQLRGVRPFLSAKYDITKHPRYRYLSDADKANTSDVERYLARQRRPKPSVKADEMFDYYEIDG